MKNEIPYVLIAKYLSGECNASELEKLEHWKKRDTNNNEIFDQMKLTWKQTTPEPFEPDVYAALGKVSARLGKQQKKRNSFSLFWIGAAAALLLGFGIFAIVKITGSKSSFRTIETFAETIPREVMLPDGSSVFLRNNSTLIYPEKFKGERRKVMFKGEAYFVIIPDKSKPFIIESGKSITKVLGTEFNLRAVQSDTVIRLTVTKGLVSFTLQDKQTESEVNLMAGEVGEADLTSKRITKFVNTDLNFLSWKTGVLKFENQQLSNAIKTISEYYKQPFGLAPGLDSVVFSTTFDSLTIDQAIESLKLILDVDIALVDGVYILRQKS
jgi:transmembrane sensor